jgi:hypothetical protein
MAQVKDLAAREDVIDEMIAEQPPIKPALGPVGRRPSGQPLASRPAPRCSSAAAT